MKKRLFCRTAGLLLTLVLLFGLLSWLNRLTYRKSFPNDYDGFLPSAKQYDVLLLGDSHVWDGIFPLELWGRQGITAYNLGYANSYPASQYWLARCALEHSTPKVIVFNCHGINSGSKAYLPFYQNALAAFPFSLNKIRAAYDLCPPGEFTADERFSLICGFSAYHSRWSELTVEDFTWEEPAFFGARPLIRLDAPELPFLTEASLRPEGPNVDYVYRLAEECRSRGIKLVLTTLPFSADEKGAMIANGVSELAAELGVDYLNMLREDPVDFQTDFADRDSHLNISGACKVSARLADILAERCGLEDHRGDPSYGNWELAYTDWLSRLDTYLDSENLMLHYLMLLNHPRYAPVIYLSSGSALFEDPLTLPLLRSICGGAALDGFAEAAAQGSSYLLFCSRDSDTTYEAVGTDRIPGTPYGEIRVIPAEGLARVGVREVSLSAVNPVSTSSEALCFVFTADLDPLDACSHSFNPGELGQYYRSDYFD